MGEWGAQQTARQGGLDEGEVYKFGMGYTTPYVRTSKYISSMNVFFFYYKLLVGASICMNSYS